ncbi:hypothetical protein DOK78_002925 [Enterococcus sp. DIV2402]|uniref:MurR/RpiR family transcriptional regulator n=1 Tax=Candidatus Enterococcus lowellii TaxID=2230877 RepID=A0ABZ2SR72_9ENTE|nr:MurR/RpiR family transcriptional regulator [Enterococcus sp. DIV2402]MBO0464834.1 MurR/RpiR family transcriptional regulator [Enterococcus sp. DIV2402]
MSNFQSIAKSNYENLTKAEKTVIDFILADVAAASMMTISDVSKKINVSIATISRLSKKLGYQSYQEMRLKVYDGHDAQSSKFFPNLTKDDSFVEIATNSFYMSKISLDETQSILMEEDLKKAIDLLAKVKTCSIFGLGASQVVAMNAFHCFLRSSLNCTYIQDYHLQMMSLTKLGENDCLFLISHTGHNKDMIQLATIAREKNIPIITITSNRHSPLAKLSDIILVSVSDETKYRPEAVSSLLAQIALVDALFMIYAIKVDDNEEYLLKSRAIINKTRLSSEDD